MRANHRPERVRRLTSFLPNAITDEARMIKATHRPVIMGKRYFQGEKSENKGEATLASLPLSPMRILFQNSNKVEIPKPFSPFTLFHSDINIQSSSATDVQQDVRAYITAITKSNSHTAMAVALLGLTKNLFTLKYDFLSSGLAEDIGSLHHENAFAGGSCAFLLSVRHFQSGHIIYFP